MQAVNYTLVKQVEEGRNEEAAKVFEAFVTHIEHVVEKRKVLTDSKLEGINALSNEARAEVTGGING